MVINNLLDGGSFRRWDHGTPESVITGEGLLKRHRVADLAALGIVEQVLPDHGGLAAALAASLASLSRLDDDRRLATRALRFRQLGS